MKEYYDEFKDKRIRIYLEKGVVVMVGNLRGIRHRHRKVYLVLTGENGKLEIPTSVVSQIKEDVEQ